MTPVEWAAVLGGAALIVFELWFFLGAPPRGNRPGGRRPRPRPDR